ncbi:putative inorganic phosphate cotransporter [Ctenocephalides felis]|uniref:putative inorganic phosphate cotransporter n=1 Tax=Ctenocephalides felis TaxID=7515 RepID=UPI000E6E53EA|nr:putative inorganic phosphate cotransporter [Ctenocephalides felis]
MNDHFKTRMMIAGLGLMALAIIYGLRVNISVALVAMVNHTAIENTKIIKGNITAEISGMTSEQCGFNREQELKNEDGPFDFTSQQQGLILSSYYWGYALSMFPGGRISELWSAKWVMFFAVITNMVMTLMTPIAAFYLGFGGVIVCQFFKGIGGGVTFPCTHCLLSHWSPKEERSKLSSFIYAGTCLGTVASQYMSGYISSKLGWAYVFYISGCLALPWVFIWLFYVTDYPVHHKFIAEEEREMLGQTIQVPSTEKPKMPWRDIATSKPFWAVLIGNTCSNWGFYLLLIEIPVYLRQILLFGIQENGLLTAIPFFAMATTTIITGNIMDYCIKNGKLTVGQARKIATGIASLGPGTCLAILSFVGCWRYLGAALLCLAVASHGAMYSGVMINHIDIAPRYAGSLIAFTNIPGTISGIAVPVFVGYMTDGNQTIEAWRFIFFMTLALYLVEFTVFTLWSSGEEQPWNNGPTKQKQSVDTQELPMNTAEKDS